MASLRTPGVFNFSANFEALIAAPLDARLTVETLAALTDGATIPYPYLGMIVAVTSDSTPSNNGLYYCTDIGTAPSFASATTVWTVVGTGAGGDDIYVTGGTVSGTDLELTRNDGNTVVVDLSSIAGGGGSNTYVTGGTTSAATGGTDNIDLDLTLNDASTVNIDLSQAIAYRNAAAVKKTVGGITTGDFPFIGTGLTLQQIVQAIFYPAIAPTVSFSSASLGKSFSSLVEIGYTANLTLNASFTRGTSVVSGQSTRSMGLPIDYNYTGDGITGTETNLSTSLTDSFSILSYEVAQGTNSWGLSVSYSSVTPGGSTGPVYDDGTTYVSTAFTNSGAKTSAASLEGVYPIYAATVTTTVLEKQTLVSMLSANNLEYQIVAETSPGQHTFALPDPWTATRPLVGVYYFNTVSNSYDPANKISEWGTTSITKTIQGNTINYTQYTKLVGLPAAGTRKIKLVF
jgi:hypothetical protein